MRRVLLVEDHEDVRELVAALLADEGFHVVADPDGTSAWRRLEELDPSWTVVLDLRLPGVDGATILKEIRSRPVLSSLRVIVLSAEARAAELVRGLADAVVLKPFQVEQLLAALG